MPSPKYSVIVPVYNRPEELGELLESLTKQTYPDFEVLIVEDGSTKRSESVYEQYVSRLRIQYFYKPNTGPGPSRNFGFEHAKGEYFVVFDSDCILPSDYFSIVTSYLAQHPLDAWGGPDRGHESFSSLQQAMAYTMSSVLTTGGIRGGKNQANKFQPRSFNMGISRKVWEATGGFKFDRLAEDIELSIRIRKAGFKIGLIAEAFVYHKRRSTFKSFFRQVFRFGAARINIFKRHRRELKITHILPSAFVLFLVFGLVGSFISTSIMKLFLAMIGSYCAILMVHSTISNKSYKVGLLSVIASILQLTGYGCGLMANAFAVFILRRKEGMALGASK